MKTITHDLRDTLEGREVEIYRLLCENLTNPEIAQRMDIQLPTVCWHLRNIYKKLGVDRMASDIDTQLPRRRAILYSGTKIEQVVIFSEGEKKEKFYSLREIRNAAKKIGCSLGETDSLVSFLEMERN